MNIFRMAQGGVACFVAACLALAPAAVCAQPAQAKFSSYSTGGNTDVGEGIKADLSHASSGYVGFKGTAGNRLKVQLTKNGTYTYDLSTNGTPNFYPLNMGSGTYTATVYRNTSGNRYATVGSFQINAKIKNEREPFLYSNIYVNYTKSSKVVKQAKKLTKKKKGDTKKLSAIYKFLSKKIKYDYNKAKTVESGYIPNPDTTLKTKKGICFDYASCAAAMLRSVGIPCRLITGYVAPNDVYHSWNLIYVKKKGWITTEIKAKSKQWGRIDVTFAATGGDAKFIGNGKNYVTRYVY